MSSRRREESCDKERGREIPMVPLQGNTVGEEVHTRITQSQEVKWSGIGWIGKFYLFELKNSIQAAKP